jgi:MFS family permease
MGADMTRDEKYRRGLNRNVRLLQYYSIGMSLIFVLPVLVPFYRERGLGFAEFMIGEAVFSAVMIIMEVPSGWLSDVWKRKHTLALATLTHVIGWTTLLLADSFAMTVVAQGMLGVGVALLSGTNSALLYDSLLELGRESEFRRLEGRRHATGLYAVAGSSLLGGFLYAANTDLPVILTALSCFGATVAALLMTEPGRHRVEAHKNPFVDMAQTVAYAVHGHREIAGIIILSAVLFASTKMLMWSQQPYYMMTGVPEAYFGMLAAVGFLIGGLGGQFGHLLDGRFRNIPTLLVFMGLMIVFALTAALWPGIHAIPLLLAGSMIFGFGYPRVQAAINKRVDGSRRATILSAASLTVHLVAIPLFFAMGTVEKAGDITDALRLLAFTVAGGAIIGLLLIRHINGRTEKTA